MKQLLFDGKTILWIVLVVTVVTLGFSMLFVALPSCSNASEGVNEIAIIPKFSNYDMVKSKVGGHTGQIIYVWDTKRYKVRFTGLSGLFTANMYEEELEAVSVADKVN